jgi:hypothetical protein
MAARRAVGQQRRMRQVVGWAFARSGVSGASRERVVVFLGLRRVPALIRRGRMHGALLSCTQPRYDDTWMSADGCGAESVPYPGSWLGRDGRPSRGCHSVVK